MGIIPFWDNFGRTHPLNPRVLFFIMRPIFLWDNQDRSRDHPHRMGSGDPWPRPNIHTLYPETSFAVMHRSYSYIGGCRTRAGCIVYVDV